MDSQTGVGKEIPSQVLAVEKYDTKIPGERYQPTTVVDVAFFADVPANSSRIYLAFYGNPKAPYPKYESDLKVKGEELGLTIENSMYKVRLSEKSGAIDEITMKTGDQCTFDHHLETNGALHWNPDIYAPPRPWLHASDWNPPAHYSVNYGPLCVMTKRHGPLDHYPEIEVTITYVFYDRLPWILISSTTEVKKDIPVQALRNGEIVLNRKIVDEFAWPNPGGGVGSIAIEEAPRHPNHAKVLPHDIPWVCLFSRKHQCGLGVITANLANFIKDGGFARTFRHYSYLQWGPWVYYARPLVYTFISNNPARLIPVSAGSLYYEKMALVPIAFTKDEEAFTYLERTGTQLKQPIHIKIVEDTDPRAPREWVPPILVEEFEEIENG
jgi:hypothetical protein